MHLHFVPATLICLLVVCLVWLQLFVLAMMLCGCKSMDLIFHAFPHYITLGMRNLMVCANITIIWDILCHVCSKLCFSPSLPYGFSREMVRLVWTMEVQIKVVMHCRWCANFAKHVIKPGLGTLSHTILFLV
jgi:hypothetical protein